MSDWIYWDKKYEVNFTVRDIIERAKKAGKNLKEVLKGIKLCNPPKTSTYYVGRIDEEKRIVSGSEIEDDGDSLIWSKKLDEILEYFDVRTLSFEWPPRYHPLSLQELRARAIE